MDRRKSLKWLTFGGLSTGVLLEACENPEVVQEAKVSPENFTIDRHPDEVKRFTQITSEQFFDEHELATIGVLADLIIPADDISGSATDAKVPDFIEFMVKDRPELQTPIRGGLRWVDAWCLSNYGKSFVAATDVQKKTLLDQIAYPDRAKDNPRLRQGVAFFNKFRDLTATGFFTSEIGVKDIGYAGNKPNQWNGVPDEVLKQYGLAYTPEDLARCVSFDKKSA